MLVLPLTLTAHSHGSRLTLTLLGRRQDALVHALLKQGVSVFECDADANTALIFAAATGNAPLCQELLGRGAEPETRNRHQMSAWDVRSPRAWRPLVVATQTSERCNQPRRLSCGADAVAPKAPSLHTVRVCSDPSERGARHVRPSLPRPA